MSVIGVWVTLQSVRLFRINVNDRKQWQTKITHLPEQAIQRGLIDHRARQDGCSVACMDEAHLIKLVGPAGIQVSLDANLVPSWLVTLLRCYVCFTHAAPRGYVGSLH